jgi:hypothetical protein
MCALDAGDGVCDLSPHALFSQCGDLTNRDYDDPAICETPCAQDLSDCIDIAGMATAHDGIEQMLSMCCALPDLATMRGGH